MNRPSSTVPVSITFLGTADAFHSGGRRSSSYLLEIGSIRVVVDCGPTTPWALTQTGIDPRTVGGVLQTHFHGDHLLGLPMLLLHHQILGGPAEGLMVYGPHGLAERVLKIYELVYEHSATKLAAGPPIVHWKSMSGHQERPLPGDAGTVQAVAVAHSPEALGYRLEIHGRTVVFTGDTKWHDELPELTQGADLVVIDCTSMNAPVGDHLCYREICEHRDELGAGRIILSHLGEDVVAAIPTLALDVAEDGLRIIL